MEERRGSDAITFALNYRRHGVHKCPVPWMTRVSALNDVIPLVEHCRQNPVPPLALSPQRVSRHVTRFVRGAISSLALSTAACVHTAPPFIADAGAITINLNEQEAAAGFRPDAWVPHMGAVGMVEARNQRVRVLLVAPSRLRVHVGDTIAPLQVIHVSGLDVAGVLIPQVAPLFGPLRPEGIVRPLANGMWLAERVGRSDVEVRVLRIAQGVSNDSAMVRLVTVDVVP